MSEDFSLDAKQETRLVVLQLKVERLEEKQEDLRERLKVVEKWVIGAAAVLAAGVTVIGFATNISKAYLYLNRHLRSSVSPILSFAI